MYLYKSAKLAIEIFHYIVSSRSLFNSCMTAAHTDIISDSNITFLASSNFYMRTVFRVDDIEYLLRDSSWVNGLQYNEIALWFFNIHNINDSLIVSNLEWEELFADLTIKFFEFNHNLLFVNFDCPFSLEPSFQAFKMDATYCACAVTRRDQRIKQSILIYFIRSPTNSASWSSCTRNWMDWILQN